ncbi:MAG: CHAT domain-containing protein [Fimbriimonadales bacterium]|nr:CHAT domain-containing protein [Fimbriimonadales bacterium]
MRIVQQIGILLATIAFALLSWAHTVHHPSPTEQRDNPVPPARQEKRDMEARLRELEQKFAQGQYSELLQTTQEPILPPVLLNHLRARALHRVRPQEPAQREELIRLWETVRQSYRELGYAPTEVEATLALAFCYWQTNRARAESLLNEAWARVDAGSGEPLLLAQALSFCAEDWFEMGEWTICERLWERALALQEAHGAEELALARTRYNLGVLALKRNHLEMAQTRLREALATQEQLAPDSPALASTLLAMGELAQRRSQHADAQNCYQRSLYIHGASRISTLETARIHLGLADLARQQRQWNDAQNHYERALQIAATIDPRAREAGQAQAGLGVVALEQDKLDIAEKWLLQAQENPRIEPLEKAQVVHELGRVAWRRGRLDDAAAYLARALEQQQSLRDTPLNIAKTLYNLGALMLERGELLQARDAFTQSLEIREREAPRSLPVAHTLMGLGFVAFYKADFIEARRFFEQARALYESLNAEPVDRSRALTALGLVAVEMAELAHAQSLLEESLRLQEESRLTNTALHAQTRIGLGNLHLRRGDWDAASRHYRRAHDIASQSISMLGLRAQALTGLGNLAFRQRDLRQAETYYKQALEILETHFPRSPLTVLVLLNYGMVALESGDPDVAQTCFSDAEKATAQLPDSDLAVRARLNRAILQIRNGATADALPTLNQLIPILQSAGRSRLLLGQALFYRGVSQARQGNDDAARNDFNRALELYQQVAPNTIFVALTQLNLAKQDYRASNAPSARTRLEQAVGIIERQRNLILDPDLQVAFSENYFEAYTLLALLEAERGNAARAAELLEQSRARTLLAQIQRAQVERHNASPQWQSPLGELRQLEAERLEVRRQIAAHYLMTENNSLSEEAEGKVHALYEKLAAIERRQQELESVIRARFPAEASLLTPPPINLAIMQQLLESDAALVFHALVEGNILIVVVTKQAIHAHHQPIRPSELREDLRELLARIRTRDETPELIETSARLYQTLLAPIAQWLQPVKRVLLCPEGELNQLPWAALVVEKRDGKPIYWIERVAIHLTPSMSVYRYARLLTPAPQGALVAAVSEYGAMTTQSDSAPSTSARIDIARERGTRSAPLTNLPAAAKEADALAKIIPNAQVLREYEVHPAAVQERARAVRVLHFACHAEADSANPLNSALKFGGQSERQLTAAQIMAQWRLQADMVMLSACETASGKVYRYEGVIGLARAFLHAGTKSVGATLWKVEDESTAQLVEDFYKGYILQKLPKDRALQQAQVQMLKRNRAPYYWSGFVLIGDCQ